MFDIVLHPRAETDLADIWQFTFETWGQPKPTRILNNWIWDLTSWRRIPTR
ncbi:MAG: hypothetical protein OJF51_000684 [Nitrospira sp.]|nr:MAG: hypothetical protein OJF51_000684 [Nitrospira sp.]